MSGNFKPADQPSSESSIAVETASSAGRRRFVRKLGVGVVVPAVLTVTSRSAMATTCLSASATASINLTHSRPNRTGAFCAGGSPGYWRNAAANHGDHTARNKRFELIYIGGFPGLSMEAVCGLNGTADPFNFGAHLAAAWCNLVTGKVHPDVLNLTILQDMWAKRNTGYYPISGSTTPVWSQAQIVTFLKTTMI
jgi:hypothetical protein